MKELARFARATAGSLGVVTGCLGVMAGTLQGQEPEVLAPAARRAADAPAARVSEGPRIARGEGSAPLWLAATSVAPSGIDLDGLFAVAPQNVFMVKVSYWMSR